MIVTVDFEMFRQAFIDRNRHNQFSYEALRLLFDYLESHEDERNQTELDIVAICCDYSEEKISDIAEMYDVETEEDETLGECVVDFLEDACAYVGTTSHGTIVFFNQ